MPLPLVLQKDEVDPARNRPAQLFYFEGMPAVTLSSEFQVVIPVEVRRHLALAAEDRLEVFVLDGRIELVPVRPISTLQGFLKGIDTTVNREADRL
ncbi:MAG: AbrB/MazE/SpoVT family DNA-binding domain-containing protein [Verrucomicrobiota bacterium]|nr:AbrB/MazE/SpoVT family DNA-binding domain-containing protein [Verrucomicrobiota bacterium]